MAKCAITGKKGLFGNRVSHANNKTRHRHNASVQSKRIWDDERGTWVRVNISKRGLRMLSKMSLSTLKKKAGVEINK